jgi:hypothetical protein
MSNSKRNQGRAMARVGSGKRPNPIQRRTRRWNLPWLVLAASITGLAVDGACQAWPTDGCTGLGCGTRPLSNQMTLNEPPPQCQGAQDSDCDPPPCDTPCCDGNDDGNNSSDQTDNSPYTTNSVQSPHQSAAPILYLWGSAHESADDIRLTAPGMTWSLRRGYTNGAATAGGATTQGNNWMNNCSDKFLYGNPSALLIVVIDAATERQFVPSGGGWTLKSPQDSYSTLTADPTNHQYIFTDQTRNLRTRMARMGSPPKSPRQRGRTTPFSSLTIPNIISIKSS